MGRVPKAPFSGSAVCSWWSASAYLASHQDQTITRVILPTDSFSCVFSRQSSASFPWHTSFSRCLTFCLKPLNVLPNSGLCSASRPHFLGLYQVTCDSCLPYTFIKKQFAKENTLRFFLQHTNQGHNSVWEHLPGTWGPLRTPQGCVNSAFCLGSKPWPEFLPSLPFPSFLASFLPLQLILSTSVSRVSVCPSSWGLNGFPSHRNSRSLRYASAPALPLPPQTSRSTCPQLFAWETPYVWTEFIKQCVEEYISRCYFSALYESFKLICKINCLPGEIHFCWPWREWKLRYMKLLSPDSYEIFCQEG